MNFRKSLLSGTVALLLAIVFAPQQAEATGSMSYYLQNKLIDSVIRAIPYTGPAVVYIALETTIGSQNACGTEVSGGNYSRAAVTSSVTNWAGTQGAGTTSASAGTSSTTSNNVAITFPAPSATWGNVQGLCWFDAASGGNLLLHTQLTTPQMVLGGQISPSFAVGALSWSLN